MIELVEKDTPISREILEHALFQTVQSRQITELNWNKQNMGLEAIKRSSTLVTEDQISTKISDITKKERRQLVDIKIVSLRWMFQDGKRFCDLVSLFK